MVNRIWGQVAAITLTEREARKVLRIFTGNDLDETAYLRVVVRVRAGGVAFLA